MGKIKTFFYSLKNTFTSLDYYADILKAPFGFSLKFFYFFFFLFSLVATAWITVRSLLPLNNLIAFLPEKLVAVYPEELEITLENGKVSTNIQEPYCLPISSVEKIFENTEEGMGVLGIETEKIECLLVIDTAGSIEDFYQYKTYALLTEKHLSYINDKDKSTFETVSFEGMEGLEGMKAIKIDQALVEKWVGYITPYLKYILPVLVGGTFIFFLLSFPATRLFYNLFLALVLLIVGRIVSYPLSYGKSYQVGLHLVVISTVLFSIVSLLGLSLQIPFLQTIILGILGAIILSKLKSSPTSAATPDDLI